MAHPVTAPEVSIIGEMITPALFILASGSLIATVLARIGRIVELVRKIAESAKRSEGGISSSERTLLKTLGRRADLAETAMVSYYAAVFCFVLTCLLIGIDQIFSHSFYLAPVGFATVGVTLVLIGSGFMVAECRLAVRQLKGEISDITAVK